MAKLPTIDFRSDTVTRPTAAMRQVMAQAEVGDDVLGDDPSVIALQDHVANLLGKEAACFVPSCTMANQCAIRAHTEPGDEIIAHKDSHIIHYETGAPAALSSVMIAPLDGTLGQFTPSDVAAATRPNSSHFARSRLLLVENTHNRNGGAAWPLDQLAAVAENARLLGLRTHLDGARMWNAAIASACSPSDIAKHFDTVSCCFSKGLGAPAGSAVAGSKELIARVHRFRKMFGGNMRQAGILAAAAHYAVTNHYTRLADDHANARHLADGLSSIKGLSLVFPVQTNMVFVRIDPALGSAQHFSDALRERDILTLTAGPDRMRLVTHLDVPRVAIDRLIAAFAEIARG